MFFFFFFFCGFIIELQLCKKRKPTSLYSIDTHQPAGSQWIGFGVQKNWNDEHINVTIL